MHVVDSTKRIYEKEGSTTMQVNTTVTVRVGRMQTGHRIIHLTRHPPIHPPTHPAKSKEQRDWTIVELHLDYCRTEKLEWNCCYC